jgi:hypothetical protein
MRDVTIPQWSWPTSGKVLELRFEVHRHFCKTLSVFTLFQQNCFHVFCMTRFAGEVLTEMSPTSSVASTSVVFCCEQERR